MVLNKIYAWWHSKSPNQDQATPSPVVADKPMMIDGWDIEPHIAAQSIATSLEATRKRDIETETAAEEFITHHYAYQAEKATAHLQRDGSMVVLPVFNADTHLITRRFHESRLITKHASLVGYIHTSELTDTLPPQVNIIWRGTKVTDLNSVLLNIEPDGAVAETWTCEENIIIQQIAAQIDAAHKGTDKPVELLIGGHSQGGATSQLTTLSLLAILAYKQLNKKPTSMLTDDDLEMQALIRQQISPELLEHIDDVNIDLAMLNKITLVENSSTGVSFDKAKAFHSILCFLNQERGDHDWIQIHALKLHGDPITQTGQTNLGAGLMRQQAQVRLVNGETGYKNFTLRLTAVTLVAAILVTLTLGIGALCAMGLLIGAGVSGLRVGSAVSIKNSHCEHQLSPGLSDAKFAMRSCAIFENNSLRGQKRIDRSLGRKSQAANGCLNSYHYLKRLPISP